MGLLMAKPVATPSYQFFGCFNAFFSTIWQKTRVGLVSLKVFHLWRILGHPSATVITKGAKILWKWHIFKLRLLALYWTCLCETTTSNTKRTWIFWTGTNYFCLFSICGAKLKKLKGVESSLLRHLGLFLKAGGMNQKKKNAMLHSSSSLRVTAIWLNWFWPLFTLKF